MGASLTYYYLNVEPGTYMYHCHVEATEHMQMGMLGNLWVKPAQDGTVIEFPVGSGKTYSQFVYNDGDGSTGYNAAFPVQLGGFDMEFHDASWNVQPLPFAAMWDDYPMINGRGYPDTINTGPMPQPTDGEDPDLNGPANSQTVHSLITASPNQRILLRISNLNVTRFHTLGSTIPMQVVGKDAKLLRSVSGENLYYTTNSLTIGGGQSVDVIIDTTNLEVGATHFLYTTNLNLLSNNTEDYGGMMTEIRIQ
jgi:FtsP/CotA-like multicopper oxidase with cupredoxin domain